jgi:uncharacterized membrane protein
MEIEKIPEWQKIALSFAIITLILRTIFFNQDFLVLLKAVSSIYWVLILPGIGLTYLLHDMNLIERFAISVAISAALVGVSSYYLGLFGVHIRYSAIFVPLIFTVISIVLMYKQSEKINKNAP